MFTIRHQEDAISIFNKPLSELTPEELYQLGKIHTEEDALINITEIKLPDIFISSLTRVKNKKELKESILDNAAPFKHNGEFYKLYKVDLPTLSYKLYKEPKNISTSLIAQ
jgi:hypothetical protein